MVAQYNEYLGVYITLIMVLTIAGLIYTLNGLLGPKKRTLAKSEPFECGVEPFGGPFKRNPVQFYLVGMLFILFDVEIVWLFPWAVVLSKLGWLGLFEMFFFVSIMVLGFGYAWRKGALEWER